MGETYRGKSRKLGIGGQEANVTDKEYKALKRKLDRYLRKWIYRLGLRWWRIDVQWHRGPGDARGAGYRMGASCVAHWKYLTGDIVFHMHQFVDMKDDDLERLVIHELCHCLVNEMREKGIDHEERVTTLLENAFWWTAIDAHREGKKCQPAKRAARKGKSATGRSARTAKKSTAR